MLRYVNPEAGRIVRCLSAVKQAKLANITKVSRLTGFNRNAVSVMLNSCEGFGLVKADVKGRSEVFNLTPRAEVYTELMDGNFSYLVEKIGKLLSNIDKIITQPVKMMGAELFFWKRDADVTSEVEAPLSEYNHIRFELETLFDAFCLASSGLAKNAPERKVVEEVTSLLRHGNLSLFYQSAELRELGKKYLEKAKDVLESVAAAKELADKLKLDEVPLDIEEIGKDERGRPIYRVK